MLFALTATAFDFRPIGLSAAREAAPVHVLANAWKQVSVTLPVGFDPADIGKDYARLDDPWPGPNAGTAPLDMMGALFDTDPVVRVLVDSAVVAIQEALPLGHFAVAPMTMHGNFAEQGFDGVSQGDAVRVGSRLDGRARYTVEYDPRRAVHVLTIDAVGPDPDNVVEVAE